MFYEFSRSNALTADSFIMKKKIHKNHAFKLQSCIVKKINSTNSILHWNIIQIWNEFYAEFWNWITNILYFPVTFLLIWSIIPHLYVKKETLRILFKTVWLGKHILWHDILSLNKHVPSLLQVEMLAKLTAHMQK